MHAGRKSQNFLGHWGPAFSGWERGWPVRNALLYQLYYRAKFDHSRSNRRAQLTEIRHKKIWPLASCLSRSLIGTDTDRSATYDFLVIWSIVTNHEPISYRFRDKWRFRPKIANFSEIPIRMYLTLPLRSHLWTFVTAVALKKLVITLPDSWKTLTLCAFVSIQYQSVTYRRTERRTDLP